MRRRRERIFMRRTGAERRWRRRRERIFMRRTGAERRWRRRRESLRRMGKWKEASYWHVDANLEGAT
jgi:hypothetical protein